MIIEALKASLISALVGGVALICFLTKALEATTKAIAFIIACLIFALLLLKAVWENFHNIFWSVRNRR